MSDLKQFKKITDEILADLSVNEAMKEKVRKSYRNKSGISRYMVMIPAACLVLILALGNFMGNQSTDLAKEKGQDAKLMTLTTEGNEMLTTTVQDISSLEEARKLFGEAFLTPDYLPEGYQLARIQSSGAQRDVLNAIILIYTNQGQEMTVVQEKGAQSSINLSLERKSKGGSDYYLGKNSLTDGTNEIELHWFSRDIHYVIRGLIIEEEALKMAESMQVDTND